MRGALLGLACAVAFALLLGGCGGGDSASTSSTSPEVTTTPQASRQSTTPSPQKSHQGSGKQDKAKPDDSSAKQGHKDNGSSSSPNNHLHLVRVPPISSAPTAGSKHPAPGVKTVKGGDNSVQEYGVEADASERTEASITLQAYLNARAQEDWPRVCSLLAKKPLEQLEKTVGKGPGGCAETVSFLKEGRAQMQEQAKIAEVLSFRGGGDISGDPGYLIFTAPPGQTLFSMPMYLQGGAWKVGLAVPSELPV